MRDEKSKGSKTYIWMASWREGDKIRNVIFESGIMPDIHNQAA